METEALSRGIRDLVDEHLLTFRVQRFNEIVACPRRIFLAATGDWTTL